MFRNFFCEAKKKKKTNQETKLFILMNFNSLTFFFQKKVQGRVGQKKRQTNFKINMTALVIPGINIQSGECTWRAHGQNSVIWLSWIGRIPLS